MKCPAAVPHTRLAGGRIDGHAADRVTHDCLPVVLRMRCTGATTGGAGLVARMVVPVAVLVRMHADFTCDPNFTHR